MNVPAHAVVTMRAESLIRQAGDVRVLDDQSVAGANRLGGDEETSGSVRLGQRQFGRNSPQSRMLSARQRRCRLRLAFSSSSSSSFSSDSGLGPCARQSVVKEQTT